LKAAMSAQSGGLWHALLASAPAATASDSLSHSPGVCVTDEAGCRFDMTVSSCIAPTGPALSEKSKALTPDRYHVCIFRSSADGSSGGGSNMQRGGGSSTGSAAGINTTASTPLARFLLRGG